MNTASPKASSTGSTRVPELDGIRGLAILLVLIWHYVAAASRPEAGTWFFYVVKALGFTWSGVDLFFVLSGFLLGGILLDNHGATNYFRVFYIRRACRIFPPYFLWLLFFVLGTHVFSGLLPAEIYGRLFHEPFPLWSYATYTQNFFMAHTGSFGPFWLGITWSLAIEEQFYLVLPCLIFHLARRGLPYLLCAVIVAVPMFRWWMLCHHNYGGFAVYVLMPARADALLLGVLLAWLVRQRRWSDFCAAHQRSLHTLLLLLLLPMVALRATSQSIASFHMSIYGYSLLALFYSVLLLVSVTAKKGPVVAIMRIRWLRGLGMIAYGVYLFHQAVNYVFHGLLLGQAPDLATGLDWLVTGLSVCVTLLCAYGSWVLYEKRIIAWGHSFRFQRPAPLSSRNSSQ